MRSKYFTAKLFYIAQPYFTPEGYFTNPERIYFIEKTTCRNKSFFLAFTFIIDAGLKSPILSGFSRFHQICSKHSNKANNLDALLQNAATSTGFGDNSNEIQHLRRFSKCFLCDIIHLLSQLSVFISETSAV